MSVYLLGNNVYVQVMSPKKAYAHQALMKALAKEDPPSLGWLLSPLTCLLGALPDSSEAFWSGPGGSPELSARLRPQAFRRPLQLEDASQVLLLLHVAHL